MQRNTGRSSFLRRVWDGNCLPLGSVAAGGWTHRNTGRSSFSRRVWDGNCLSLGSVAAGG